jgi:hypothetical protein
LRLDTMPGRRNDFAIVFNVLGLAALARSGVYADTPNPVKPCLIADTGDASLRLVGAR